MHIKCGCQEGKVWLLTDSIEPAHPEKMVRVDCQRCRGTGMREPDLGDVVEALNLIVHNLDRIMRRNDL